jgi:hypothetical protein
MAACLSSSTECYSLSHQVPSVLLTEFSPFDVLVALVSSFAFSVMLLHLAHGYRSNIDWLGAQMTVIYLSCKHCHAVHRTNSDRTFAPTLIDNHDLGVRLELLIEEAVHTGKV